MTTQIAVDERAAAQQPSASSAANTGADAAGKTAEGTLEDRQRAYLLHQLLEAPGNSLTQGEANKKIGTVARRALQLQPSVANRLREALADAGYITAARANRVEKYALTDDGREYLQTLPRDLFAPPKPKKVRPVRPDSPVPLELAGYQQAFILLLLLKEGDRPLRSADFAKRLQTQDARRVGFEGAVASGVMRPLIEEGCVEERRSRRSGGDGLYPAEFASYRITSRGEERFLLTKQYPGIDLKIPAKVWNKLVEDLHKAASSHEPSASLPPVAATDGGREAAASAVPPTVHDLSAARLEERPEALSVTRLADAILGRFNELLRERYAQAGMVPIHELRAWVAERFGPEAAGHKKFDEVANELRRQDRVRFVTITDLRDGTAEQLEASIPGVNETFFYLEPAHEQSFNF